MKRRCVKLTAVFICALLCSAFFPGCGSQPAEDYDVEEVRCVFDYGSIDKAELDIITPDGSVMQYIMAPYYGMGVNMFKGEIPSDDKCKRKEFAITQEEWTCIVEAIKSNDFMTLPEELPGVEAYDGSTCYIEVKTSIGEHRSGGYCAGNGAGDAHQRFYGVKSVLRNLIGK